MERYDTDSLASVNIPLPNLVVDEEESLVREPCDQRSMAARAPVRTLTVPGQPQIHILEEQETQDQESLPEEHGSERPRTVLSMFRSVGRPLSALSARAKSALSTSGQHFLDIPSNVRNFLQRWVRERRRGRVAPSGISTPNSSVSDIRTDSARSGRIRKKMDSLAGSEYGSDDEEEGTSVANKHKWKIRYPHKFYRSFRRVKRRLKRTKCHLTWHYIIDPNGDFYLVWMALMFLVFIYNAITIPLRAAFELYKVNQSESEGTPYLVATWLLFDHLCDLLYLVDIIVIQSHVSFLSTAGVLNRDLKVISKRYVFRWKFWVYDILAMAPLQIFYAVPALRYEYTPLLRLPRLLRLYQVALFLNLYENTAKYAHAFRAVKMVALFLYIIHMYTCAYYYVSRLIGIGSDEWVYDGQGNSYLHCFYWATLTAATIHDLHLRDPTNDLEYFVEMIGYLLGVIIVAVIISEISNIVAAANGHKIEFQNRRDHLKHYMQLWKTPKALQDKVQLWFDYAATQEYLLNENEVLESLPPKMRTDLAIHVHLDTLSKVKIFQDCEKTLLRELVFQLEPALFVPGDYICRKGDIGKEMYIVNQGIVQVVGGTPGNEQVLANLGPGNVFGEISLLAVGGGNRRTAHVISKGFSGLFVLRKRDLNKTLVDYPDAQQSLLKKAKYLLKQDRKREAQSNQPSSAANLAAQVRHSKAAQDAVTAFTTLATRAALKKGSDQSLPAEEVHEATVHMDSSGNSLSPQEAAAARMRHTLTHQASQVSQATTLSLQSAASHSLNEMSDCSSASSTYRSSLWSSIRGLAGLASLVPESDVDPDSNESDLSTTSKSSLWQQVQTKATIHQDAIQTVDLPSQPSATGITSYNSLWPKLGGQVKHNYEEREKR